MASGVVYGNTWAVIVGIDGYKVANPLTCAVNDARSFCDVMTDSQYGNIPKSNVKLLYDKDSKESAGTYPSKTNILSALSDTIKNIQTGDRLIFFYTGHGVSYNNKSYIIPIDARITKAGSLDVGSCISSEEITDKICNSSASEILIFLDACRSNSENSKAIIKKSSSVFTDGFAKAFQIRARNNGPKMTATFYACDLKEKAYEWQKMEHGVFTYFLLEGLKGKAASTKGVTLNSLDDYVGDAIIDHRKLKEYAQHKQTPWVKRDGPAGSLVLSLVQGAPPPISGKIVVSFPQDEECEAKNTLIEELKERGYKVVDIRSTTAKNSRLPLIKCQYSKSTRKQNGYDLNLSSLYAVISVTVSDKSRDLIVGPKKVHGSGPLLGDETSAEELANQRASMDAADFIEKALK